MLWLPLAVLRRKVYTAREITDRIDPEIIIFV